MSHSSLQHFSSSFPPSVPKLWPSYHPKQISRHVLWPHICCTICITPPKVTGSPSTSLEGAGKESGGAEGDFGCKCALDLDASGRSRHAADEGMVIISWILTTTWNYLIILSHYVRSNSTHLVYIKEECFCSLKSSYPLIFVNISLTILIINWDYTDITTPQCPLFVTLNRYLSLYVSSAFSKMFPILLCKDSSVRVNEAYLSCTIKKSRLGFSVKFRSLLWLGRLNMNML